MDSSYSIEAVQANFKADRDEACRVASLPGMLDATLELLTGEDLALAGAILEELRPLYHASADIRDRVYAAVRDELLNRVRGATDGNSEWIEFQGKLIETLILVGSERLREDDRIIRLLARLLLDSFHTEVRQWAIAGLCPAVSARNTHAIAALRYAASEMWDSPEVRQEALETLEDMEIPLQEADSQDSLALMEWVLGLFQGAKRLSMGFAQAEDRKPITWRDDLTGHIHRREGALSLRIVLDSAAVGKMALVAFKAAEGDTVLKTGLVRQNGEGVAFADVSVEGIGAEGIIAPPHLVGIEELSSPVLRALLVGAHARSAPEERTLWKQWADTLANVPPAMEDFIAELRAMG